MLKPKKMCKISVVGSKSVMKESINVLHGMALLHVDEFRGSAVAEEESTLEIGAPLPESETIASSLVKVRSMASHLPKVPQKSIKKHPHGAEKIELKTLDLLDAEIRARTDELKSLEDEKSKISTRLAELKPFAASGIKLENFDDYSSLAVFVGYVSGKKASAIDELKCASCKKFPKSSIISWNYEGKTVIALFVNAGKKDEARDFLSKYGYSEINTAPLKGLHGHPADIVRDLEQSKKKLDEKRARINSELARISAGWR